MKHQLDITRTDKTFEVSFGDAVFARSNSIEAASLILRAGLIEGELSGSVYDTMSQQGVAYFHPGTKGVIVNS